MTLPFPRQVPLAARSGGVRLAGSLWLPPVDPVALLVMHPGSGPSDRDNDVLFPPIRAALLDAGVAVASYDKRGVGGSTGSWVDAGIEEQARDLLAGLASAAEHLPAVPRGAFGHSQGGWVVLAAASTANEGMLDFAISNAGPAVTMGEQERYSAGRALARRALPTADRERLTGVVDACFALMEAGADHDAFLAFARDPVRASDLSTVFGDDLPDAALWGLLVRLAVFEPVRALRALRVPLLAVFGADDDVTPTARSIEVLHESVDPALLEVAVMPGGGHRMARAGERGFVPGYPEAVVGFVLEHSRRDGQRTPRAATPA